MTSQMIACRNEMVVIAGQRRSDEDLRFLKASLLAEADRDMAAHPQYVGHFDGWRVGRMMRDCRTKLGHAFRKHQVVLFKAEVAQHPTIGSFISVTAYSHQNRCSTAVKRAWLVPMDGLPVDAGVEARS